MRLLYVAAFIVVTAAIPTLAQEYGNPLIEDQYPGKLPYTLHQLPPAHPTEHSYSPYDGMRGHGNRKGLGSTSAGEEGKENQKDR